MSSAAEPIDLAAPPSRWRFGVTPAVEFGVLAVAVGMALVSYFVIDGETSRPLTPPLVALLLVANLLPGIALLVLIGRRIARRRAAMTVLGGNARLHVRLVAIFSVLASVPTLLVAVFASLLFQYGVEFWSSDRARAMLENSQTLAQQSFQEMLSYVDKENVAMSMDVSKALVEYRWPIDSREFTTLFGQDVFQRSLSEAVLFSVSPTNNIDTLAMVNPYERKLEKDIDLASIRKLRAGAQSVVSTNSERTQSIARVPGTDLYLYAARVSGAQELSQRMQRAQTVLGDYRALVQRSRTLQLQFNVALLFVALLIVGIAVFVALTVADRLVRPVGDLVNAARRVTGGDLTARVDMPDSRDELGTLGMAFNRMTERLQEQTNALISANAQIESRRALIEAVMEGVTAGIISIDAERRVRLINGSAMAMLKTAEETVVGRPLSQVAPELDGLLDQGVRQGVVQIALPGETRTLAVKLTRDELGQILTFDDITQQLLDQRRAAWSDVARRIAHEIKNPLTPIQLAAERLQRRYGKQIDSDDTIFSQLTDTIVRQVGDLRRMVDEFSSFARMPKPVFREENLLDLGRQAMFLHEVAHSGIRFSVEHEDELPPFVADRRQIGQALTNIVKNAVEAIEGRGKGGAPGEITMQVGQRDGRLVLSVADNGIGLPLERDRIVEPYMTTRAGGTGLGLAIVKKIVEEHFGTIGFSDRPGGGTVVTLSFDTTTLAGLANSDDELSDTDGRDRPAMLTRTGTVNS